MAYFDKVKLAGYITYRYHKDKGITISPLKLQKSLYLLYGMWAGNARIVNNAIRQQCNDKPSVEFSTEFDEDLFESDFEAWQYGPVDPSIYHAYKENELKEVAHLSVVQRKKEPQTGTVVEFVDDILDQTFEISDFSLIDLTRKDIAWSNNFTTTGCDTRIQKDQIKDEYFERLCER